MSHLARLHRKFEAPRCSHLRTEHVCLCTGLLTQFQLRGDSLMEASERQSQPFQRTTLNKHTVAIMK